MILEKFAFALRFFTSYQRWLIWQWLLISAPFLCLVPSLIFNPTKQPYLKVCNSGICWYENGYTGIPGLWTQVLNAGLWTMDSGPWTLDSDATLWTLGSGHSLTVLEQKQKSFSDSAWLNYLGCESLGTSWSRLFCRDYSFWRGYF